MIFWSQNRKVMQMKFGVVTYTVRLLLHARYDDDGLKGLGIRRPQGNKLVHLSRWLTDVQRAE